MITIFTDGSSRGNPGPGGWGAIVVREDGVTELGGRETLTTNNRMELTAAIKALQHVPADSEVTVYTDAEYVLKGITAWVKNWQKNNWRTAAKKPVENQDLWLQLIEASEGKSIEWKLVRGHAGVQGNERCDEIATACADLLKPNLYDGDRDGYPVSLKAVPRGI